MKELNILPAREARRHARGGIQSREYVRTHMLQDSRIILQYGRDALMLQQYLDRSVEQLS